MGQLENNTNNRNDESAPGLEAEITVQKLTTELENLHSNVLKSLQEDIKLLVQEKHKLADDIQKLQAQKNNLQSLQIEQQQQVLIHQLTQILANHVSIQLQSSLEQLFESAIVRVSKSETLHSHTKNEAGSTNHSDVEDLLVSLKAAVSNTFEELQSELHNYQSNFSMQLSRMYSEQEQGEAILAELVHRLRNELESAPKYLNTQIEEVSQQELEEIFEIATTVFPQSQTPEQTAEEAETEGETQSESSEEDRFVENTSLSTYKFPDTVIPNPVTRAQIEASLEPEEIVEFIESQAPQETQTTKESIKYKEPSLPETVVATPIPQPSRRRKRVERQSLTPAPDSTALRTGFILVVLSVVASALYNVSIRAMFFPKSQIFGVFDLTQLIAPTLGNCLLILMLRMLVVVPLMLVLAPIMHQGIWNDLKSLVDSLASRTPRQNVTSSRAVTKGVFVLTVISGLFLFLSQVLIYLAIGQVATGVAISLFFIYPVLSGFLTWLLFKSDRTSPTLSRVSAIACICFGELLVLGSNTNNPNISFGSTAAIASGITFAIYIVLTRICAARLHPVSFTLLNFTTMLVLSFIALMIPLPTSLGVQVNTNNLLELILSAFILGVLTLFGYVLNNLGIRKFGATRSALIGSCVPALTVIFAGLIIQESLELIQVMGVLVVTIGVSAVNLEKIRSRSRNSKTTS
ncbi:MAG: EamA family transporter [Calothrix sp. C42_A2020_038]|nr:EamA family transporter [Calothrix sp. C42_A2020_038]